MLKRLKQAVTQTDGVVVYMPTDKLLEEYKKVRESKSQLSKRQRDIVISKVGYLLGKGVINVDETEFVKVD